MGVVELGSNDDDTVYNLRSVMVQTPDDLLPSVYMTLNRLAPAWEGTELGIGETLLMKAIANTTGRTLGQSFFITTFYFGTKKATDLHPTATKTLWILVVSEQSPTLHTDTIY